MSKKLEVLQMLKDAGDRGVRSDEFYKRFNGRGVARIYDLRQDGYEIEGRPDGKYKRYRLLNVGVESERVSGGSHPSARPERPIGGRAAGSKAPGPSGRTSQQKATLDSGAAASPLLPVPVEARARTIPSAYDDVWVDEAA